MKLLITTLTLFVASASPALAQSPPSNESHECITIHLTAAQRGLEDADFETADVALDRANSCSMDIAQLRRLLELRVLLSFADQRLGALELALRALHSLGDAPVPAAFPRAVRARYEELRSESARVHVEVEAASEVREGERSVALVPRVQSDEGRLVQRVEVLRRDPEGNFTPLEAEERVALGDPENEANIEYMVRAFGPGGALLLGRGSASDPLRLRLDALPGSRRGLVLGLVIGGTLLLIGGAALIIAGVQTNGFRGDDTTLIPPSGVSNALVQF